MSNSGSQAVQTYSICGFDVGSENCYIAVARAGGIEMLLNDYSQRSTPAYVSLGDKQRELGVSAKQKQLMKMQSTYYALKRLAGRQYNDVVKHDQLPFPIEQGEHGDVVIRINHNEEDYVFTVTQLIAMTITKLRLISNNAVDGVLNCPNYFSDTQRRVMLDAALIAGLNPLRILPDLTAISIYYGFYRTNTGIDSNVVFMDCGHTTTQAALVHFKNKGAQSSMHVLAVESDRNLGGRILDELIADYFIKKDNLQLNKRGKHRLLAEAEKLKKQMSANMNQMPLNVENISEDRDFTGSMNRELFEELAQGFFQQLQDMLTRLREKGSEKFLLSQKGEEKPIDFKVDAIEIVGGGSRIPAIKKMITETFGAEPTTTLNADEAVARGCALQCAMLSPTFKVARELVVNDFNYYSISCKYWFETGSEKVTELKDVFARGAAYPFTRRITLNASSLPLVLELEYTDENNHTSSIGQYKVTSPEPLVLQKNKLALFVKLDANGLASLSSATVLVEDLTANGETETAPMDTEPKEANGEAPASDQPEEGKGEKKTKMTTIHLTVVPQWVRGKLSDEELQRDREIETNLILADKNWKERIDARNELEEYVYEWRSKIEEGRYDIYVAPSIKEAFLAELNSMQQWLYSDEETGETQSKSVYTGKIQSMKNNFSDNILFRESEFNNREHFLERLGKSLQLAQKLLETEEKVDEKKIERLHVEIKDKQKWFEESHALIASTPLTENPVITTRMIQEKTEQLESATRPIMDELHRKRQEKQREEDKRKKAEEEEKKKQQQEQPSPQPTTGDQQVPNSTADPQSAGTQPMDVDPQAAATT